MAEQAHARAAIDDLIARRGQDARGAPTHPPLPPRPAGQQGLDVTMREPGRRGECLDRMRQTRPRTRLTTLAGKVGHRKARSTNNNKQIVERIAPVKSMLA